LVLGDHASTFQIDLTQLVTIGPGEPAQMIHRDQWSFDRFQFPRGFEAEVATMWAVTHFTEESGATRMVVGSHRWEDDPDDVDQALSSPAIMTKGSVLLDLGSIFHGGGANTIEAGRIGMNVGYSLGWLILPEYLTETHPIKRVAYLDPASTGRRYLREHTALCRLAVGGWGRYVARCCVSHWRAVQRPGLSRIRRVAHGG